jgi:hypothetical protein
MNWRPLSRAEIEREFPASITPILAAIAETNGSEEDTYYADTCFVLYDDGQVHLPYTIVDLSMLEFLVAMLRTASKRGPDEGHQEAAPH